MGISHITWVFQFVQTAVPGLYSRIYMDDRSFVSRSPETLIAGVQAWQGWSSSVGLQESSGKTQVTATQATGCQDLAQNIDPGFVTTEFHVLGCTAQVVVRKESTAELKRIAAAQKSLQLLSNLRWSYERFWKAVQSHAMPKVSYGWLARLPTKATAWSLWAAVRRGQRVHQHANKFLRAIIWGGNGHLDILPCATLIRIVSKMIHCREARWADRLQSGSPVHTLHRWFSKHGYRASRPWCWAADHESFLVDLCHMQVQNARHAARQGWRWFMWKQFVNCGRHECSELQGLSVSDFSRIDFTSLRKSAENKPPYRAVICGALLSPACMQDQQVFSSTCPWCDNTLGHWHHVVWECPSRPSTLRRPNSPVCARFGWGASRQEIEWLQVAAQAIWSVRHGNAAFD